MENAVKKTKLGSTKIIAKIGILSAIAYLLRFIQIPLPIFPSFLQIDISDIPAIFGGMSLGPMAGLAIVVVKNFLQGITASTTGGIGEFANIIIGGAYVLASCFLYRKIKGNKGVIIGGLLGIVAMTAMGCLINYYVMLPLYTNFMPMEAIIQAGQMINPKVTDLSTFIIWMIAPFNIFKGVLMTIVTLLLFKKMEKVLTK